MTRVAKASPSPQQHLAKRLREGLLIFAIAFAAFFLIALLSYHQSDPSWSHASMSTHVRNAGGRFGAWIADFLLSVFGYVAYVFPLLICYNAWLYFRSDNTQSLNQHLIWLRAVGAICLLVAGTGLASLHIPNLPSTVPVGAGGLLGNFVGFGLARSLNILGTTLLLLALFLSGSTLVTGISWFALMDKCGAGALWLIESLQVQCHIFQQFIKRTLTERQRQVAVVKKTPTITKSLPKKKQTPTLKPQREPVITPSAPKPVRRAKQKPLFNTEEMGQLPDIDLLDPPEVQQSKGLSHGALEAMSRDVETKLQDFNVSVQVVAVHPGPVITRFELQLAPGVKVSKITGLAKDLARSLSVISVRVVEVIPGKSVIGLELPNEHREVVRLSEVIASESFEQSSSPLCMALGKDIAGHPVSVDLAKMPHLLVAGTTGSGKSVGLNAMLLSLLYKSTPQQVRLILVDPKMLELSIYDDIPHLLTPVVTDMKDAANALRWCVGEMENRYRLMAALGVRNLAGFNRKVEEAERKKEPIVNPLAEQLPGEEVEYLKPLPCIVVVIDELADMMMVVGKKVEELIARIAQKARAAGIHLILATQRPSVDVITGLIKANVPTRIAFQVSSRIDSRTIIDQQGAEQLLGYGDMLYLPPGSGVPIRVHGAFVDDHEVHNVVNALKQTGEPVFIDEITHTSGDEGSDGFTPMSTDSEQDELYDKAVQIVIETRRASISSIQRRLKIGYNRAARMIEAMESAGLVSPMESNGNREVLIPAQGD